jgi:hypothetical protein
MTTTQLQLRRDTTTNIDGITPAQGEPIYDVTRKALVLGDGATTGGDCVTPFAGTWTPVLAGSTTPGSPTYSLQQGDYVVVGRMCTIWCEIEITAWGGSPAGNIAITGLPFAAASIGSVVVFPGTLIADGLTLDSGYTQMGVEIVNGSATAYLVENGSNKSYGNVAVGNLSTSGLLTFTLTYPIAQPTG